MLRVLPGYENRQPSPLHFPEIAIASNIAVELSDRAGQEESSTSVPYQPSEGGGGYGWVCVACCFTVNCFTWGVVAVGIAVAHSPLQT